MRRCDELAISQPVPFAAERLPFYPVAFREQLIGERKMPILILWAVPAILIVGGGIYLIGHLH
ncbi:hypothetical protein D6B98_28095 [Bradyrhizobium sp. LVM 105]|nr:hypothetical protein D6B98_28095 [Bradyrhizobium sp. LVM 105]